LRQFCCSSATIAHAIGGISGVHDGGGNSIGGIGASSYIRHILSPKKNVIVAIKYPRPMRVMLFAHLNP
jgi:hypothetical protein